MNPRGPMRSQATRIVASTLFIVAMVLLPSKRGRAAAPISSRPTTPNQREHQPAGPETNRQKAKRHLRLGVALYEDGNYAGALVQFQASFRAYPTSSALQNIALCQMKLFRYVEALRSIEKLQRQFVDQLSDEDWNAAQRAKENLQALVGTLRLTVSPPDAHVTLNGKPIASSKLGRPMLLATGTYTIHVRAPGYEPQQREVEISGGENMTESFVLKPSTAQVTLRAGGAKAKLLIDGHVVGQGEWSGRLPAGVHYVQVLLPGYEPNEVRLELQGGTKVTLPVPLGPPTHDTSPEREDTTNAVPVVTVPRRTGWYGALSASYVMLLQHPDRFEADERADTRASSFGIVVGNRIVQHFEVEGFFDTGTQRISGVYKKSMATAYGLTSYRSGAALKVMTGNERVRLTGAAGVGLVYHDLTIGEERYAGLNGLLRLEVGPQFNIGHLLIDTTLHVTLEGANNALSDGRAAYGDHTVIPQVGVGLRMGYSLWAGP